MPEDGEDVDEGQSPLRKVQRYIPGFKGCLQIDDMRDADRMLRMQLSQKISVARKNLEAAKASVEENSLMVDVSRIESALGSLKRLSSEIGYADSGYPWGASNPTPVEDDLERLYDCDAGLLDQITLLLGISSEMSSAASDSDITAVERTSSDILTRLAFIEDLIRKRMTLLNRA